MIIASMSRRALAFTVDHLLFMASVFAILIYKVVMYESLIALVLQPKELLSLLTWSVVDASLIFAAYEGVFKNSPGKGLCGLTIADRTGLDLPLGGSLLRAFIKWLISVPFLVGCIAAYFTKNRITLHDYISHSLVIENILYNPRRVLLKLAAFLIVLFAGSYAGGLYVYKKMAPFLQAIMPTTQIDGEEDPQDVIEKLSKQQALRKMIQEALPQSNSEPPKVDAPPSEDCKTGPECRALAKRGFPSQKGTDNLWRACRLYDEPACILLGRIYERANQKTYAEQAIQTPCEQQNLSATACDQIRRSVEDELNNLSLDEQIWNR